jgi:AcrR family transcriptional regulator
VAQTATRNSTTKRAIRSTNAASDGPRRRLTADARKRSILEAARRAFSETGDVKGTTIRAIAERSGISEGVIYRHFESKEQLFYEAVVEPLREAVDDLVAASEVIDLDEPLTPQRQLETMNGLYRQLISTFDKVLPLLGLVLFGDPQVAQRFYRKNFSVAMDRLAVSWGVVEGRYGIESESNDISARAVMGIALILALERHYSPRFDRDRALELVTAATVKGFFARIEPTRRRR